MSDDGLHTDPVLVLDPGRHTAAIKRLDADREGRFLVTASDDKTVRVWAASDGRLLRTIRLPAGPGDVGKAYAAAISPDSTIVAAGRWTASIGTDESIYLFDRASGRLLRRAGGLPNVVNHLAFSPDGKWLAAALGRVILRLEGQEAFDTIETLRRACRARRHGDPTAPSLDELLTKVEGLSLELSAIAARAARFVTSSGTWSASGPSHVTRSSSAGVTVTSSWRPTARKTLARSWKPSGRRRTTWRVRLILAGARVSRSMRLHGPKVADGSRRARRRPACAARHGGRASRPAGRGRHRSTLSGCWRSSSSP